MGWEGTLLPRLVSLLDGETVPYAENLAVGLDAPGKEMSRNHVGMAIAGEAVRAGRHYRQRSGDATLQRRWQAAAKERLVAYLRNELTDGLWGGEVLCPTPHDAYHLAVAMFARLAAVESQDPELLRLTAEHCRALGRLCATLSDPTGEVISAGTRVPLFEEDRWWKAEMKRRQKPKYKHKQPPGQKPPSHSALTEWWRYVNGRPTRALQLGVEPMYVGLRAALSMDFCDTTNWACQSPGPFPLARPVIVHRWLGGHQVEILRRGKETGITKGSARPNGICDWVRAEYGKGKRGASLVTFGMLWQTPAPKVPSDAKKVTP